MVKRYSTQSTNYIKEKIKNNSGSKWRIAHKGVGISVSYCHNNAA